MAVDESLLSQIVDRVLSVTRPDRIILFGSAATGGMSPDSDIDLFVILQSDLPSASRSAELSLACRPPGLAVDFIVKTPDEVQHRLQIGDPFVQRILEQGRVVYAR